MILIRALKNSVVQSTAWHVSENYLGVLDTTRMRKSPQFSGARTQPQYNGWLVQALGENHQQSRSQPAWESDRIWRLRMPNKHSDASQIHCCFPVLHIWFCLRRKRGGLSTGLSVNINEQEDMDSQSYFMSHVCPVKSFISNLTKHKMKASETGGPSASVNIRL